jgi:hypothetical protein
MSHTGRSLLVGLVVVLLASFFSTMVVTAAERITIVGTVNEDYQIVTDDGQVYEINRSTSG